MRSSGGLNIWGMRAKELKTGEFVELVMVIEFSKQQAFGSKQLAKITMNYVRRQADKLPSITCIA